MSYIVGVDIGGTFTDVCAVDVESGEVFASKARSTPWDLIEGLIEALTLTAGDAGLSIEELLAQTEKFAHGTTQTSNVMLTWVGAKTGLITTRGFADELLIMRARGRVAGLGLSDRRHLRTTQKPTQIVPRDLIVEVSERIDYRGRAIVELTREEAEHAVRRLLDQGVESIAVSLLWAHENPQHELLIADVARELAPDVHVSLGHRLSNSIGEYERTSTAVVNAFVAPTLEDYLARLSQRVRDHDLDVPVLVQQASGGVASIEQTVPIRTIESGPAAGMVAVRSLMESTGHHNVIATDVGGTTFKVGLLVDDQWSVANETIINQYSLSMPMIDIVSIGAGGGSIAWVDDTRLRIGPLSAGGDPGPACYGWGGTLPTVTDADAVLGFLNPQRFLGGRLELRRELAEEAIREHIAEPLFGGDVVLAAAGIRKIIDSQMGDLVRKATIERGHDPRDFMMVSYGGAGPLHASGYSRGIGVRGVLVPRAATGYSAYGAASSHLRHSVQRSVSGNLLEDDSELRRRYGSLEDEATAFVLDQRIRVEAVRVTRWAEMRYAQQLHAVRVEIPAASARVGRDLTEAFAERYVSLYGAAAVLDGATPVLLRIGVDVVGEIAEPAMQEMPDDGPSAEAALEGTRDVFWPELMAWHPTPIYDGVKLRRGNRIPGCAVIEQPGTTIAVPPGAECVIDRFGNCVIEFLTEEG
ncbi:hydantoinase/oxoprolinase family protein [Microbacterium soli]|uniref:Hydantoinase/oxoprolinase family protein n=1 Tax=Microbacterium soli TaxID=446075 RepID=A0ABP7ND97_9MICO